MTGTAESIYSDGTYQEHNQSWHVEDSPWKAQQILRILQKNNVNPATVAEVGCGAGEILRQLSIELPDATFAGYEMSPQAIALCKSRESDRVSFQLQDLTQTDAAFDCLLCIDVFEHIEDYMGFTRKLGPKAKHVVFHIPLEMTVFGLLRGIMLHSRAHSGHIHYFSKETALATLKDCGFRVIDSFYTTPFLDFPAESRKRRMFKPVYRALFKRNPDLAVKLFGQCSLMVLATAR